LRKWVVGNDGRAYNRRAQNGHTVVASAGRSAGESIGFFLPQMTVDLEDVVALMSAGLHQAETHSLACRSDEYRSLRVAAHLSIAQHFREVNVHGGQRSVRNIRAVQWGLRRITHAEPQRFSAVVEARLSRILRIFCAGKVSNLVAAGVTHVDVVL